MFVIIGQSGVDLGQREMRVLELHFLRTPAVCDLVQHNFNNLRVTARDPGDTAVIKLYWGATLYMISIVRLSR
jgi:hypothetical protein